MCVGLFSVARRAGERRAYQDSWEADLCSNYSRLIQSPA
jgi:hypothetical protein